MEVGNIDLIAKLEKYKNSMSLHMADQLDSMIASNRENIRMKCLEAALKFYDLKSKETSNIGLTRPHFLTNEDIINLAEEFYKFVRGE